MVARIAVSRKSARMHLAAGCALVVLGLGAASSVANAGALQGSLATSTVNGTAFSGGRDLITATNFVFTGVAITGGIGSATGAYVNIPVGTFVGGNISASASLSLSNPNSYSISFYNSGNEFGVFSATSAKKIGSSGAGNSESLTLYLLGSFTPGADLLRADLGLQTGPAPSSQIITINETSGSTSSSSTLATPPTPIKVPEPGSLLLFGTGLLGLGFVARSKRSYS